MCFAFDAHPPDLPADLVLPPLAGGAAAEVLELTSADGTRFSAALAESPAGAEPAVVILPDVRGLYRFYIELAACAQSVRLTMQEMDLHLELGQLPWPPAHVPELLDVIVAGHRAVVDAIEARDQERARALTAEHIDTRTLWSIELRLTRPGSGGDHSRRDAS